jgi:hypothetical protein
VAVVDSAFKFSVDVAANNKKKPSTATPKKRDDDTYDDPEIYTSESGSKQKSTSDNVEWDCNRPFWYACAKYTIVRALL